MTASPFLESRLPVGSSASRIAGSPATARARPLAAADHYDALGQLDETTDRATGAGSTVAITFGYDSKGRLKSQTGGGITSTWTFDPDGRPITRTEGYFADTIRYDARGKRVRVVGRPLFDDAVTEVFTAAYDGLGQLVASSFSGGAWNITDEMRVDGFGHAYTRYRNRGQIEDTESYDLMNLSAERLMSSTGVSRPFGATDYSGLGPAVKAYDDVALSYDQGGNVTLQESIRRAWTYSAGEADYFERAATGHQWTWSFYDADERPRVVQQHRVLSTPTLPLTLQHEYWYDALGRRILTRTRADSSACGATQLTDPEVCQQAIARTFWDGDQVFREDRQPGGWQSSMAALDYTGGNSAWYGTIRTVTAGAIDVPLVVWKGDAQALVLRRNWRGNVAGATQVVGTTLSYTPTWPAAISDIRYAPDALLSAPPANSWWGSLALDQRDATGLLYRRNRYYDPQSGRFTQEDPIGLAGGLNLYGYAGGDPINFGDPFGLCPRVTVNGSDVVVEANLYFGNPGTYSQADATAVRDGIMAAWSGSMHGYNVTVKLTANADVPDINVEFAAGHAGGEGGSRGRDQGGRMIIGSQFNTTTKQGVAGHEFGHVFQLGHSSATGNLMRPAWAPGNNKVSKQQLEAAIANCRVEKKTDDGTTSTETKK